MVEKNANFTYDTSCNGTANPATRQALSNYNVTRGLRDILDGSSNTAAVSECISGPDQTNDGSIVWPADRKKVALGTISLTALAPDNEELQRKLTFNPIYLTDGIQLSDDPFVPLRSAVYGLSVQHRH